jgi:hypothetical protein
MNELVEQIFELLKQTNIDVDFTDEEYSKLFELFRKKELNQFNVFIIQRVLTKKNFTLSPNEIIPYLTSSLADKVDYTKFPTETNNNLKALISIVYKVIYLIDIKKIYNTRF